MVWDITVPADTDPIRQGASAIRTFKSDLQNALQAEGVFPGPTPASPVFRWKPRRDIQANRPANDPVNPGTVFYNTDLNEWEVDTGTAWVALAQSIPVGSVSIYAASIAPAGWLLCDGSAVSRTTYANLFALIGITHGQGDGSTTFNVPDYRGRFLRGVDGAAGRDPDNASRTAMGTGGNAGNAPGSVQVQKTAVNGLALTDPKHAHPFTDGSLILTTNNVGNIAFGAGQQYNSEAAPSASTGITLSGDNETRPINAYVNYIIKV